MSKTKVLAITITFLMLFSSNVYSATWELTITSVKENYTGGETASFDIQLIKDGEIVSGNTADVEATFPSANYSASLTVTGTGFQYSPVLNDIPAEQNLKITIYTKNHEEKIIKLEEKIQKLLAKSGSSSKKAKKAQNNQDEIEKLQRKIEELKQPLAQAEKMVTVISRNSFSIKEGQFTNQTNITLLVQSSNSYELMISENSDFSGAGWQPYSPEISFDLSSGDGEKEVFVKFRLKGTSFEEVRSAKVILDTIAPVVEMLSPIDGAVVTGKPE